MTVHTADVAIAGGGIAGLWALRRVLDAGYNAVLFEASVLGGEQTLASQGMIHGGLKYALAGLLNPASEAIATMPARWRACLAGSGEIDLSGLPLLSDSYYLFAERNSLGRLSTFFASKALRGRIRRLERGQYPPAFTGFNGVVYALEDFVVDVPALTRRLVAGARGRLFRLTLNRDNCQARGDGVEIDTGDGRLQVRRLVNCAGNGSADLSNALSASAHAMQRRPLHQVMVHAPLPAPLFAHCLTGLRRTEPRLTLTTHTHEGGTVLYLGGQLASDGVARSNAEQIAIARQELVACLPWLDFGEVHIDTLRIDRAEPRQAAGLRPDQAFVHASGPLLQCWPTKLTLVPDLADRVLQQLPPAIGGDAPALSLPTPPFGAPPWTRR
ncbi:MAG: FAD-dependent oxidoreductase [Pseudomonadales bacterium]|nr:FAD-dependent oxidoreductase [Pseudomonadales bacterium]